MTKQEAIHRLYGLIADINAEEVADHIKDGVSLCDWTNLWRCEAKDVLRVLEDTADALQTDCYMCKWMGDRDVCGRCRNRNLFAEADIPQTDKNILVINMALVECKVRHKGCKNCNKECMWRDV